MLPGGRVVYEGLTVCQVINWNVLFNGYLILTIAKSACILVCPRSETISGICS